MAAEEDHTIGYTFKKLTKSNQEKKSQILLPEVRVIHYTTV